MKTIIDYYIEFCHPTEPTKWNRTYDFYSSLASAQARITQFKTMDYMRACECRIVQRTQTFELLK